MAKHYWLQTIYPYVAGRKLHGVEGYLADYAHHDLRGAVQKATIWNDTEEGKRLPVPAAVLAELQGQEFRAPEMWYKDDSPKPEILAQIAAPLMNKGQAKRTPAETVRMAHDLFMASLRFIEALPRRPDTGVAAMGADLLLAFGKVTFDEIVQSTKKSSGQLPLLPPVQTKRNEDRPANTPRLSKTAVKRAIERFLREHTPHLTQGEDGREQEQDDRSWQAAMDDCRQHERISLHDLCTLRRERFNRQWEQQKSRALKRKPPEKKPKNKTPANHLPISAATSPKTAGKREK